MGHQHEQQTNKKALKISFFLISIFMIIEMLGGILTNSLALLSDAGHMLSDAASLGLSLLAIYMGGKKATNHKTYGYKRFEVLTALINGLALIVISTFILIEAYQRFLVPPDVAGYGMLFIAIVGMFINLIVAFFLMKGDTSGNLNVKSAFFHVIADLLGSVGAVIASLLIIGFNWGYADPIASIIVSLLIFQSGWRVTKESIHVLMEGTPEHLNLDNIKNTLFNLPFTKDVHDLHAWSITSGFTSLSCHVVIDTSTNPQYALHEATNHLKEVYKVQHTTIQIEQEHSNCEPCN